MTQQKRPETRNEYALRLIQLGMREAYSQQLSIAIKRGLQARKLRMEGKNAKRK